MVIAHGGSIVESGFQLSVVKPKLKVITLTNHNKPRQSNKPISIRRKYMKWGSTPAAPFPFSDRAWLASLADSFNPIPQKRSLFTGQKPKGRYRGDGWCKYMYNYSRDKKSIKIGKVMKCNCNIPLKSQNVDRSDQLVHNFEPIENNTQI